MTEPVLTITYSDRPLFTPEEWDEMLAYFGRLGIDVTHLRAIRTDGDGFEGEFYLHKDGFPYIDEQTGEAATEWRPLPNAEDKELRTALNLPENP